MMRKTGWILSTLWSFAMLLYGGLEAAPPALRFYAMTALQLVGVLLVLVFIFMGVSSLTISLFGRVFRRALTRSYVLFLGWNMLRSQRLTRTWKSLLRDSFCGKGEASYPLGLGLAMAGIAFLGLSATTADVPSSVPALVLIWLRGNFILVGLLLLIGAVRAFFARPPSDLAVSHDTKKMRLRASVTLPNLISLVGIGIGVWALIVVMSVMSGFESDLRSKILETNPHIMVSPSGLDARLEVTPAQRQAVESHSSVIGTDAFLEEEAMISSPFNSSVQLTVRGIDLEGTTARRLQTLLTDGVLSLLGAPEQQGKESAWEFSKARRPGKPPKREHPGPKIDTDDDWIVMPAIPGAAAPRPPVPIAVSESFARDLNAAVGQVVEIRDGTGEPVKLIVMGIYKPDPSLNFQPDWVTSPRIREYVSEDLERQTRTVRHGSVEKAGRMMVLTDDTPMATMIQRGMIAGVMSFRSSESVSFEPPTSVAERVIPGMILGRELAASLRVHVGDEIQLISLDGEIGPMGIRPKAKGFRVAGIFETGMYEFDLKLAYLKREDAVRFFDSHSPYNRFEVVLKDPSAPGEITAEVAEIMGEAGKVQNWQTLNRNLFSALKLEKIAMFFVLGFIILVASFNIVSSLSMLIQEKSQEIAILKSMGATNQKVMGAFVSVGLFLGLIGAGCGALMGVLCCIIVDRVGVPLPKEYYIPTIPVEIDGMEVTVAFLAAMVICVAATVYPSRAASNLTPVEGLRYE